MTELRIGYARVSTDDQDLTAQRDALAALDVAPGRIYVDALCTSGQLRKSRAQMRSAAEQGRDTQCGAGAARLRRLARRLPSHADALHELADILAAPDQPEHAPRPEIPATSRALGA